MSPKKYLTLLAAVSLQSLAPAAHAVPAPFTPLGSNLILNGDAEADPGSPVGDVIGPVSGYATTGQFTVVTYGAPGGFPTASDPGPASRGLNFFAGGPTAAGSSAWQSIYIADRASLIDSGRVNFTLSAWLGGYATQEDNAVLTLSFLDASNAVLGGAHLGPVTASDRAGNTGLLFVETAGLLPVGTRAVDMTLQLTRVHGTYNDGYADNLSLVLTSAVPELPSGALLALGLLPLAWRLRQRD